MTDSAQIPGAAVAAKRFHARYTCEGGLVPRTEEFQVFVLVSPAWLTRPDPGRVKLVVGFQGGADRSISKACDVRETISLEQLAGANDFELGSIFASCESTSNPFLVLLDTILARTVSVTFSLGDQDEKRITLPRISAERLSRPVDMLLTSICFASGAELSLHFPRVHLGQFFVWHDD